MARRGKKKDKEIFLEFTREEVRDKKKESIKPILTQKVKLSPKNKDQQQLIDSIIKNEITICSGIAGSGKAQPLDSILFNENGIIKLKSLNVGDKIFTESGELTEVVGIFNQGIKKVYKIIFSDGSSTECCEDHLWSLKSASDRNNDKEYKVLSLKTIKNKLRVHNDDRLNYSIPLTKPVKFTKKEHKISPYLMGVLLGDGGFTTNNITISSSDIEIINECMIDLNNNLEIKKMKSKYGYVIKLKNKYVGNNVVREELLKYSLLGLKSYEKFIPENYLYSSIDDRINILNGLMDTDGTISKKGAISYSSSSYKLIDNIIFLIESLGGVCGGIHEKECFYKKDGKIIKCKKSYRIHINLPQEFSPFKLKRKKDRIVTRIKYKPIRYVSNIFEIGEKECACIKVSNESSLYLTNNFIVTHNTYIALGTAINLLINPDNFFEKIYLVKSVTPLKGEELGYLKGDLYEKLTPFMWSFDLNLAKLITEDKLYYLVGKKLVEYKPLAYMRGATIDNAIVILDEAQNVSIDNARTFMTRIGENSKMICIGDENQIDLKNQGESSLTILLDIMNGIGGVGVIKMNEKEINCRNPIITQLESKFKEYYTKQTKKGRNGYTSNSGAK